MLTLRWLRRGFSARQWSDRILVLLDFVAISTLYGTGELQPWVLAFPLLLSPFLIRPRLVPSSVLFSSWALVIAATVWAWFSFRLHPLIAVAHAAPVGHSLLWLMPRSNGLNDDGRHRGWRIGVGLVQLMLASVLSAELRVPLGILAFVIGAALALSCAFLDRQFAARSPALREEPLPKGFIRRSLYQCLSLLLLSAILFPLLPRPRGSASLGLGNLIPGYTEQVNLQQWESLKPGQGAGDGRVLVRLFPPEGVDLPMEIRLGLLRAMALDAFDGKLWQAVPKKIAAPRSTLAPPEAAETIQVEAVREALDSEALPAPYGTLSVQELGRSYVRASNRLSSGAWVNPFSRGRRVRYQFQLPREGSDPLALGAPDPRDLPDKRNLEVPEALRTERMSRLARKIFDGARNEREKAARLMNFFRDQGFSAIPGQAAELIAASLQKTKFLPLEQFLFIIQEGHCEWFASASAVLLRLGGVPTRLVAGYRLSTGQLGGTLTLRSADAHAWLELWTAERGWEPLDPTPRALRETTLSDYALQLGDLLSAYWYRYVVTYEWSMLESAWKRAWNGRERSASVSLPAEPAKGRALVLGAGILATSAVIGIVLLRWRARSRREARRARFDPEPGRKPLLRLRHTLERRVGELEAAESALLGTHGPEAAEALRQWRFRYEQARFGPPSAVPEDAVAELKKALRRMIAILGRA